MNNNQVKRKRQLLDVYPQKKEGPVAIFVHGGAWGSGSKELYHLLGRTLQSIGFVTVIPSYSMYPYGLVEDMIDDIDQVIEWVYQNIVEYGGNREKIIMIGHSAGAHLVIMALLEKVFQSGGRTLYKTNHPKQTTWTCNSLKKLVLMAGVYNITKHYDFEAGRAVEDLSPMKPAMGGYELFSQYSPTTILNHFSEPQNTEYHYILNELRNFPNIVLHHSSIDKTVPYSSTEEFHKTLQKLGVLNLEYILSEELDHVDWALGLMGSRGAEVMVPLMESYYREMVEI